MDSQDLAQFLEKTDSAYKPWLLVQLRLKKLEEHQDTMPPEDYAAALADIHQDLMNLGEWWVGREDEMFG